MVGRSTACIMWTVNAALLPGVLAAIWLFGTGVLVNLAVLVALALGFEAAALRARGAPVAQSVRDGSAVLTAMLLALALPPNVPWFTLMTAAFAAIVLAKHLYGGLGNNVFNPAMVGYAVALVSFPAALATWPAPDALDGHSGATALTTLRYREGLTIAEVWMSANFGAVGARGVEWQNGAFLCTGLMLAWRGIIAWRIPAAMLATLGVLAAVFYDGGSSASAGSPFFHFFTGGTMLAAFFVATDPVTHPTQRTGQLVFGATVGALVFTIRAWGNYPDGIAFAVLLANAATPYMNHLLRRGYAEHDPAAP